MSGLKTSESLLGDFRTDARMLLLVGIALPVGLISALVAKALLWLIAEIMSVDLFEMVRVADVMDRDVPLIPVTTPLPRYSARIASGDPLICNRQGTLPGDENGDLVGIITRGDVVRCFERSRDETLTVEEAGTIGLVVAYPDETLHDAIARMLRHDIGRLPVVERENERKAVGYLGRSSILSARERYHREEEVRGRGFEGRPKPVEV